MMGLSTSYFSHINTMTCALLVPRYVLCMMRIRMSDAPLEQIITSTSLKIIAHFTFQLGKFVTELQVLAGLAHSLSDQSVCDFCCFWM